MMAPINTHPRKESGFTLIELMIALVIVSILTTIAVPSYQNHMQKARRADAYDCLMKAAQRQENYFYQNNTYTDSLDDLGLDAASCGDGSYYTLDITGNPNIATSYLLTAERVADSAQMDDTKCGDLTLSNTGAKGNENGSWEASKCW